MVVYACVRLHRKKIEMTTKRKIFTEPVTLMFTPEDMLLINKLKEKFRGTASQILRFCLTEISKKEGIIQ